jgi:hypothetical protein
MSHKEVREKGIIKWLKEWCIYTFTDWRYRCVDCLAFVHEKDYKNGAHDWRCAKCNKKLKHNK